MILVALFGVVFMYLAIGLLRTQISAKRLAALSWADLVSKLEPVETDGITAVATECLGPGNFMVGMKLADSWNMIGRAEGLARMRANSDVLIALANYAQQWNPDEGMMVAERMRRDGLALRRAVVGIGLGMTCGYGKGRVPSYLHEAANAYRLMRLRLLALYAMTNLTLYARLANAL